MSNYTVEQLAEVASVPVSTLRMYQHRGLLDPPTKRGRIGYYEESHRKRLSLIADLQERGYSLAAIGDVIEASRDGRSVRDLIGAQQLMPALGPEPIRLSLADLMSRLDGMALTPDDLARAAQLGLAVPEADGDHVVVRHRSFLEAGPTAAAADIPVRVIFDEYEQLQPELAAIAERLRMVFETYVWEPIAEDGLDAAAASELNERASALVDVVTVVITEELRTMFAAFVDEYIDRAASQSSRPDVAQSHDGTG